MLTQFLALLILPKDVTLSSPEIAYMRGGEVRVVQIDGKNDRLAAKTDYDRQVCWYPDGKRLIYRHDSPDNGWNMFWCNPETKESGELTKRRTKDNRSPSFSPDGKRIAYVSGPTGLCLMDAEGIKIQTLGIEAHRDIPPSWSADSRLLYFERQDKASEILSLDLIANAVKRVTTGMQHRLSRDRKTMFFLHPISGGKAELWSRSLSSGREQKWIGSDWSPWDYNVVPNRNDIVFYGPQDKLGIYLCTSASEMPIKIGEVTGQGVRSVEVSPDGKFVAYMSGERGNEEIWIASVEAKKSNRLVKGTWPVWRP